MRTTVRRAAASAVLLLLVVLVPVAGSVQVPDPSPDPGAIASPAVSVPPDPIADPSPTPMAAPVPDSTPAATIGDRPASGTRGKTGPADAGIQPDVTLNIVPVSTRSLTVAIKLPTSDPGGSGIKSWYVSESPTAPGLAAAGWKGIKPTTHTLRLSAGEGVRTIHAWAKTRSGVLSDRSSDTVKLDQTIPTKSTKPTSYTITGAEGTRTIRAWTRDAAGNALVASVQTIVLDTVAPSITFTAPAVTAVRDIALTISGTDGGGTGITHWVVVAGASQPAVDSPAWVASPASTRSP